MPMFCRPLLSSSNSQFGCMRILPRSCWLLSLFGMWAVCSGGILVLIAFVEEGSRINLVLKRIGELPNNVFDHVRLLFAVAGAAVSVFNIVALLAIVKAHRDDRVKVKVKEFCQEDLHKKYMPNFSARSRWYEVANVIGNIIVMSVFVFFTILSKEKLSYGELFNLISIFLVLSIPLHIIVMETTFVLIFVGFSMRLEIERFKKDYLEEERPDWATVTEEYKKLETRFRGLCDSIKYLLWAVTGFAFFWFIGFLVFGLLATIEPQIIAMISIVAIMPVIFVAFMMYTLTKHTTMFQSSQITDTNPSIKRLILNHCGQVPDEVKIDYGTLLKYMDMSNSGVHISPIGLLTTSEVVTAFFKLGSLTFLIYSYIVKHVLSQAISKC